MNKLEVLMHTIPENLDAILIAGQSNRLYYTGMPSSAGTVLVTRDQAYFIIDFRYIEAARRKAQGCEVLLQDKLGEQLASLTARHGIKRIGIESGYCTVRQFIDYQSMLPDCELEMDNRVNQLIEAQRMIKDEEELSYIRKAQEFTDQSFTHICNFIKPGQTEKEIALELEFYSRRIGSEYASFDFIVVAGAKSSLPHGVPGEQVVQKGDFITMDFGCVVAGYHSDMTRTVAVGSLSDEMRRVYATVLEANVQSMASVKAGISCAEVDKVARDIIEGAGYQGCFGHGLGHSVGLEIHEEPRFSPTGKGTCEPGMIMTIEPGIYLEGRFGCRIEDMIYITESGCLNLTAAPKELIIL